MPSPLSSEIRRLLASDLTGQSSLDEFKDWLGGETWDVEQRHDPEADDLTDEINPVLAEQSGGHITDDHARWALRPLVEAAPAPIPA